LVGLFFFGSLREDAISLGSYNHFSNDIVSNSFDSGWLFPALTCFGRSSGLSFSGYQIFIMPLKLP
jgi:hypothetical protein